MSREKLLAISALGDEMDRILRLASEVDRVAELLIRCVACRKSGRPPGCDAQLVGSAKALDLAALEADQ